MAEEKIDQICELLDRILEDRTVPRNIKEKVRQAKEELNKKEKDLMARINLAVHLLEDACNEPNIPVYTRTQVWNIIALLERVAEEI